MNPLPYIFMAAIGGAAYLIGGANAAGWTLVAWAAFIVAFNIFYDR